MIRSDSAVREQTKAVKLLQIVGIYLCPAESISNTSDEFLTIAIVCFFIKEGCFDSFNQSEGTFHAL